MILIREKQLERLKCHRAYANKGRNATDKVSAFYQRISFPGAGFQREFFSQSGETVCVFEPLGCKDFDQKLIKGDTELENFCRKKSLEQYKWN